MAEAKKHARRLALLDAAGGVEPLGTGSPCADCAKPRTALNTAICWSDAAKTRLTFHYAVCDACRSARACVLAQGAPRAVELAARVVEQDLAPVRALDDPREDAALAPRHPDRSTGLGALHVCRARARFLKCSENEPSPRPLSCTLRYVFNPYCIHIRKAGLPLAGRETGDCASMNASAKQTRHTNQRQNTPRN